MNASARSKCTAGLGAYSPPGNSGQAAAGLWLPLAGKVTTVLLGQSGAANYQNDDEPLPDTRRRCATP
jgi:hypothetical protein